MDLQIREGQTVKVFQKVIDGKRERNAAFVGLVMKVRGVGSNKMITVRQNLEGVDVDRIFPIELPTITKIEIVPEKEKKKTPSKSSAKKVKKTSK